MKKFIIIPFLMLSVGIMAKPFAPIGTTWHYGISGFSGSIDYIKYEVTDTVEMGGKMCSVIEHNRDQPAFYQSVKDYMYEENDTVYLYLQDATFGVLMNYNAVPSDTWEIDGVPVKIDSIDTVSILENEVKRFYITYGDTFFTQFSSVLIEGIGDPYAWFSFARDIEAVPPEYYSGLRCFYNPDLGLYKTGTIDCDYTVGFLETKNELINISCLNKQLTIESEAQPISSVKLINTIGSTLYEDNAVKGNMYSKQLNYTGILLCVVTLENGELITKKLLVE